MTRLVTALSVAVALTAGSVSASSSAAGAASVPSPEPTVVTEPAVASFGVQRLDWNSCGRRLRCAGVRVPLDYAQPDGKTIRIAIARPADPPEASHALQPRRTRRDQPRHPRVLAFFSPAMLKRHPDRIRPARSGREWRPGLLHEPAVARFGKNPHGPDRGRRTCSRSQPASTVPASGVIRPGCRTQEHRTSPATST